MKTFSNIALTGLFVFLTSFAFAQTPKPTSTQTQPDEPVVVQNDHSSQQQSCQKGEKRQKGQKGRKDKRQTYRQNAQQNGSRGVKVKDRADRQRSMSSQKGNQRMRKDRATMAKSPNACHDKRRKPQRSNN